MKNRLFKCIALVLCTLLVITAFAGCAKNGNEPTEPKGSTKTTGDDEKVPENMNLTGMPIVKEPITLKIMVAKHVAQSDWSEMLVWKEYEKMTGVHVEWIEVPEQNQTLTEKRNLAVAGGDMPDAFFKCNFPAKDLQSYGEQEMFLKLNDMIDKYAPNFKKAIDEREDVAKGIQMVDGSIYSLPYIMNVLSPAITGKIFVNRKWLDKLEMDMPSTTEEFYNVLTAIKKTDLNGNGENDEIPLTSPAFNNVASSLRGAWGLGNTGNANGFIDAGAKDGKVRYWAADPNYKEQLMYMNKLFDDELLDEEIFQMNNNKLIGKAAQNQVGAFSAINNNAMGQQYQNDYEGLKAALIGPSGDQLWSPVNSRIWDMGAFVITNVNKHPEITMRWVDYFYSEEGIKLYFMGKEGITYEVGADGKIDYNDEINKNPDGLTYDQAIGKYLAWGGKGNPSMAIDEYFRGAAVLPIPLEAANRLKPYLPEEIWPVFSYTSEENEERAELEADLNGYVNEMTAQFVTGKKPFAEWDNYVNELKKMGLDDYLQICQTAYERYKGN